MLEIKTDSSWRSDVAASHKYNKINILTLFKTCTFVIFICIWSYDRENNATLSDQENTKKI